MTYRGVQWSIGSVGRVALRAISEQPYPLSQRAVGAIRQQGARDPLDSA